MSSWSLLKEAREVVASVAESGNNDWELLQRIDAALAKHDATQKSKSAWNRYSPGCYKRYVNGYEVFVYKSFTGDYDWEVLGMTQLGLKTSGFQRTSKEARQAAIEAAEELPPNTTKAPKQG